MDSISGPPAPSGDLRFVVQTLTGKLQVVVVQCKKVGAGTEQGRDRTASIHDTQHHLTQLRACFDRWNARGTSVPVDPCLCVGYNCKSFTKASGVCLSAAGSDCCAP
ncbi:TPA: hypothetical protein ACH3X1_001070 [Trebouxia sp. C0004]